ncbi:hypothetical protein N7540_000641 [Penicillium herquei]|nr:hypothetical protein N7540_000641 [Penicillium herquei]
MPSQEVCKDLDDLYGFSNRDPTENMYLYGIYLATIWGLTARTSAPWKPENNIQFKFCQLSATVIPTSEPVREQNDSSQDTNPLLEVRSLASASDDWDEGN